MTPHRGLGGDFYAGGAWGERGPPEMVAKGPSPTSPCMHGLRRPRAPAAPRGPPWAMGSAWGPQGRPYGALQARPDLAGD
jgi:hypothetical protein